MDCKIAWIMDIWDVNERLDRLENLVKELGEKL